jgi:hypothetical protein
LATSDLHALFDGVAVEHRKTLAQIRARLVYQTLPNTEQKQIEDDVRDFFARRYTSFVVIVIASDTTTAAAGARSLRIPRNEEIISNLGSPQLLVLPDNHIVSTYTGSHELMILPHSPGEGFDFIAPLLRARNSGPENAEELRQDWAKGQLSTLNRERWWVLKNHGISGA